MMKVIACDTNIALDYILGRDKSAIKILFPKIEQGLIVLYIATPVFLECEWVLRRFYQRSKDEVIFYLTGLLELNTYPGDEEKYLQKTLELYRDTAGVSFTDCYIAVLAKRADANEFLTRDRKLARIYQKLN